MRVLDLIRFLSYTSFVTKKTTTITNVISSSSSSSRQLQHQQQHQQQLRVSAVNVPWACSTTAAIIQQTSSSLHSSKNDNNNSIDNNDDISSASTSSTTSLSSSISTPTNRRSVLLRTTGISSLAFLTLISSSGISSSSIINTHEQVANALDMDAFVNSQLEADSKNCDTKKDPKCVKQLSEDEALCQYGSSGQARGEACRRVKAAGGTLPTPGSEGRSLGGAYAM